MLHNVQISERKEKYKYCKYETTAQCPPSGWLADNIGAWQITLIVADNICGLFISYRKKIANLIR